MARLLGKPARRKGQPALPHAGRRRRQAALRSLQRFVARHGVCLQRLRQIDNKNLRLFFASGGDRIADKGDRPALPAAVRPLVAARADPALFIRAVNLVAARTRRRGGATDQHAEVAAAVFARMLFDRLHRAQRQGDADVAQILFRVSLVHHMIVIGEADARAVRAVEMHMRAAAQRAGRKGRRNVAGVEVLRAAVLHDYAAPVMKIVMPALVRLFRAVNTEIARRQIRTDGDDAHMRAVRRAIEHLDLAGLHIDALNGVAGKRGARRTHVEGQPLAVGGPDVAVGQLVMSRVKGDLFFAHRATWLKMLPHTLRQKR